MCSGGAVAALDTYDGAGILVISGSAEAAPVTDQGVEEFFRTAWSEATQGGEMARYAFTTLNARRAALVHDGSLYGTAVTDLFKQVFTASGGEVLVDEEIVSGDAVNLTLPVSRIASAAPDLVVYAGRGEEAAALLSQLRDAGVPSVFFGADEVASQDWIDDSQGAAEGAYVSRGFVPADDSRYAAFAASFAADQGDAPGQFTEYYFDAATIVLAAIAAVGVLDADGNLVIDEERLIAEVRASRLDGVSGTVQFDDRGDRVVTGGIAHRIDKVQGGAFVRVQ
jgi:branched-chain amino acid transport system substrate-binding protein